MLISHHPRRSDDLKTGNAWEREEEVRDWGQWSRMSLFSLGEVREVVRGSRIFGNKWMMTRVLWAVCSVRTPDMCYFSTDQLSFCLHRAFLPHCVAAAQQSCQRNPRFAFFLLWGFDESSNLLESHCPHLLNGNSNTNLAELSHDEQ